jgi:Protein of unknown function (DUF1393).
MKLRTKKTTVQLVCTALFTAVGVVLPLAFHSVPNAAMVFLPMHIPVLMCGLIAGPFYGLVCGALTPVLSSLFTEMPPMAIIPSIVAELAVYGLVSGILIRVVRTHRTIFNIYVALIGAMLVGRGVMGLLNAFVFSGGAYSLKIWLAASFVTALPGIAIQLVLIPILILTLKKMNLVR